MKNTVLFSKIFSLFACAILISSCVKNNNFIKGDAKIRFFQVASTDTTQNFYLNGRQIGASVPYNTNTSYVVVPGDSVFNITSKNIGTGIDVASLAGQQFKIGLNYSVFYLKEAIDKPAKLKVYQDSVRPDLDSARLTFLNLGYTLGANKVVITDSTNTDKPTESSLGYGEIKTFKIKVSRNTRYAFKLSNPTATNPPPVVTHLDSTLNNGRLYLILFDGDKKGELKNRIIPAN